LILGHRVGPWSSADQLREHQNDNDDDFPDQGRVSGDLKRLGGF
jgi:hypothetical protein